MRRIAGVLIMYKKFEAWAYRNWKEAVIGIFIGELLAVITICPF